MKQGQQNLTESTCVAAEAHLNTWAATLVPKHGRSPSPRIGVPWQFFVDSTSEEILRDILTKSFAYGGFAVFAKLRQSKHATLEDGKLVQLRDSSIFAGSQGGATGLGAPRSHHRGRGVLGFTSEVSPVALH